MSTIGILAYGSLIEDPGKEIKPIIQDRKDGITTPFSIEFARSSSTRDGAPTVVPVASGGNPVNATILVLESGISPDEAEDLLWRRETRKECSDKHYTRPSAPTPNKVIVERLRDFAEVDIVIYTKLGENITNLTAEKLADLAIDSAKAQAGRDGKDGISYLISVKRQGISTPLMPDYENAVLQKTSTSNLEDALSWCRGNS
ncbi:MAG: hypothetical protein KME56_05885 [Candidatus Thiodiazotropha sp. (ex Ctena orbiculata)]|nr:hypothetical protein [Candidatus Thiodiazotropha taylori]MBT2996144.1 hypothetical protein [Candidatus Thiodiazotropha taylori]MBT2999712.1 hypothetical protein [Candidatus Thiodiazotropha taylori]MBV2106355.1 hypothetical protein [Candidatus Thiodiazotropha taylori]MBV2110487.1 hypothetical protein [Candidatus Thiodiazotropha taylori]